MPDFINSIVNSNVVTNVGNTFAEKISEIKNDPVNTQGIVIKSVPLAFLTRAFNMQNVNHLKPPQNPYLGKSDMVTIPRDKELYKSALGTSVVINLIFDSVSYTDLNTKKVITTRLMQFDAVLCTISQAKKIVKTEIQGRDGTVKEYIGMDDYEVSINGIIAGANGVYPMETVQELKKILDAPVPIPVTSNFLNNMDIFNVVVADYTLPQEAGGYSTQNFSISAISDTPIELQFS
jgi:hypothetical protein